MRAILLALALCACVEQPKVQLAGGAEGKSHAASPAKSSQVVPLKGTATAASRAGGR